MLLRNAIVGVTLLFFAHELFASETRMGTLRQPEGVRDSSQVYEYPGMTNEFSLAIVELGTRGFSGVYGGAIKDMGSSSLGIVVSRDSFLMTTPRNTTLSLVDEWLSKAASNSAGEAARAILPEPERPLEIMYGNKTGNTGWGLRLATASYSAETKNTDGPTSKANVKADQLDLFFGYSVFGANRMDVGIGLGIVGSLKQTTETAATETEHSFDRGPELSLLFRKFQKNDSNTRLYYGAKLRIRSPKVDADNGTTSEDAKFDEKEINLEGGIVLRPNKPTSVVIGGKAGYLDSKGPVIGAGTGVGSGGGKAAPSMLGSDDSVTRTSNWIATNIGVESPVWDDFGILGGMEYVLFGSIKESDKISTGQPKTEVSVSETADSILWSLGLYYTKDKMRVDASYSKTFLHNGPNFVSGETTSPLLAQISLTYDL